MITCLQQQIDAEDNNTLHAGAWRIKKLVGSAVGGQIFSDEWLEQNFNELSAAWIASPFRSSERRNRTPAGGAVRLALRSWIADESTKGCYLILTGSWLENGVMVISCCCFTVSDVCKHDEIDSHTNCRGSEGRLPNQRYDGSSLRWGSRQNRKCFYRKVDNEIFSPGLGRLKALLSLSERAVLSLPKKVKDNMRSEWVRVSLVHGRGFILHLVLFHACSWLQRWSTRVHTTLSCQIPLLSSTKSSVLCSALFFYNFFFFFSFLKPLLVTKSRPHPKFQYLLFVRPRIQLCLCLENIYWDNFLPHFQQILIF